MKSTRLLAVIAFTGLVPYLLVAWAYAQFTDGGSETFWKALGALLAARFFFAVIETLGSILVWRVHGKRVAVEWLLAFLRSNKFPRRQYREDDALNYLARIDGPEFPESVRYSAREIERMLALFEELGVLLGARMHSAMEAALELYSPRKQAEPLQ